MARLRATAAIFGEISTATVSSATVPKAARTLPEPGPSSSTRRIGLRSLDVSNPARYSGDSWLGPGESERHSYSSANKSKARRLSAEYMRSGWVRSAIYVRSPLSVSRASRRNPLSSKYLHRSSWFGSTVVKITCAWRSSAVWKIRDSRVSAMPCASASGETLNVEIFKPVCERPVGPSPHLRIAIPAYRSADDRAVMA